MSDKTKGNWATLTDAQKEAVNRAWAAAPVTHCAASTGSSLRVLKLTLKRKWFDLIRSGEKKHEYREQKQWIMSRVEGKHYDAVEFANGYGANVPKFLIRYHGYHIGPGKSEWGAVDGREYVVLRLGKVMTNTSRETARPMTTENTSGDTALPPLPCSPEDFWVATERWIQAVEKRYEKQDRNDLTQIFIRGPFAGWSEREVACLAGGLRESTEKFPLHKANIAIRQEGQHDE